MNMDLKIVLTFNIFYLCFLSSIKMDKVCVKEENEEKQCNTICNNKIFFFFYFFNKIFINF